MPVILVLALILIVALIMAGLIVHLLFSPWLLLAVIAIAVMVKFGPGRSRR